MFDVFNVHCISVFAFRYFSDVSDRHPRDRSLSPSHHGLSEVDAINNNTTVPNTDPNTTRKLGLSRSPRQELTVNAQSRRAEQTPSPSASSGTIDLRLNEWLINNNIDSTSRTIILGELFTYNDFLFEMDKSDLQRIGLK